MKKNIKVLAMVMAAAGAMAFSCGKSSDGGGKGTYVYTPTAPVDSNWSFETTPAWSDEFDTPGTPDASKWTYDLGGGGWGNAELEDYTQSPNNVSVADGLLTITARKESAGGENYTSTRIVSKGSITYGRIEVKAKLPTGRGTWPAIWMLPNVYTYGPWPASGEVDIMEMVGFDQNVEHFSAHNATYFAGNAKTSTDSIPGANTDFHLYREDWTPYAIRGYYDDKLVFEYINTGQGTNYWPYNIPYHLLMNIAVGGSWGGTDGVDDTAFPTSMQIDYVHFFNIIHKK